jgi:plastocyanin
MRCSRGAAIGSVLLAGLLFAACGDTTPDDTADAAPTTTCAADAGQMVTVTIGDFAFDPTPLEHAVCDSVVWTNAHDQPHTSTGNGDQTWSSGNIQPGATGEPVVFETAGSYAYICALHPFMKGSVEVS